MPCPAKITGFFAAKIRSTACLNEADSCSQHGVRSRRARLAHGEVKDSRGLLRIFCDVHQHRSGTP